MKIKGLILLMLLTSVSFALSAQDISFYQRLANKGDSEAMYYLGKFYYEGSGGVSQNYYTAVSWLKKSAKKKYAPAQVLLAECYLFGEGVQINVKEAKKLIYKAEKQGNAYAYYLNALMYQSGYGCTQSNTNYIRFLKWAADLGDATAQVELAELYMNGSREYNVSRDPSTALSLYRKAADQNDGEALLQLGFAYRYGVEGYVTADLERSFQYIKSAAETSLPRAWFEYGYINYLGLGCDVDYNIATIYIYAAAQSGIGNAYKVLGDMYYYGYGYEMDDVEAAKWYQMAVDEGYENAYARLAKMYLYGYGVKEDDAKAYKLYKQSAEAGYGEGYSGLGECYEFGYGVKKDVSAAVSNYKKAAELDDNYAMYRLYRIYIDGDQGVARNVQEAIKYLREAADNEYRDALLSLGYEYLVGENLHQEWDLALKYITLAADKGQYFACAILGTLYYRGEVLVKRDYNKAFTYLYRAVRGSDELSDSLLAEVYRDLSACYRFGRGTNVDNSLAAYYSNLAAEYGDAGSYDAVKMLYQQGSTR